MQQAVTLALTQIIGSRGGGVSVQYSAIVQLLNSRLSGNTAPNAPAVHSTSFLLDDVNYQPYWVNPEYATPNAGTSLLRIQGSLIADNQVRIQGSLMRSRS